MTEITVIAALCYDVSNRHGEVFNTRASRLTLQKVEKRVRQEGIGFLTKTLPRLGKAFDKALSGAQPLNATKLGFKPMPNSELPKFLGEFFSRVLSPNGELLPSPCAKCVRVIRQFCYLYYKYELPYTHEQEQQVLSQFQQAETDLIAHSAFLRSLKERVEQSIAVGGRHFGDDPLMACTRNAKRLLSNLFSSFNPRDIVPRHGPGAVATRQRLWAKYEWSNVSRNITDYFPLDEYYFASMGAVCDSFSDFENIGEEDLPARVILVPKDSRGPRLISCEPVDYQWIQQGMLTELVQLVENHPITKWNVFFTDQGPNQRGALLGSSTGRYATLDLKEASDRVSVDLVRLLFPEHVFDALMACRSSSTALPDGSIMPLCKFAPMGSAICFPILALTVWSILSGGAPNADTREGILVYGDDVIVPTAYAGDAIELLESFGLKVNRDKSCTKGLFRESCGTDAFQGINVTPVRFRTVWSSTPSPNVYSSWIAYANSMYDRHYYRVYETIVHQLHAVYGAIPSDDMLLTCPSLREVASNKKPVQRRWNKSLQKLEYRVLDIRTPFITYHLNGWSKLLRFFTEHRGSATRRRLKTSDEEIQDALSGAKYERYNKWEESVDFSSPSDVSRYTKRGASILALRWR
jgi:hypothetical protein